MQIWLKPWPVYKCFEHQKSGLYGEVGDFVIYPATILIQTYCQHFQESQLLLKIKGAPRPSTQNNNFSQLLLLALHQKQNLEEFSSSLSDLWSSK